MKNNLRKIRKILFSSLLNYFTICRMDDNVKQASSYKLDQEILDGFCAARGISMTVEEVAGLSTCKYSERVRMLKLSEDDLAFLKGLRRRIKNRLASQNSRRRSMEQLRRLTRELRAVRACQEDARAEQCALLKTRAVLLQRCCSLRKYVQEKLQERADTSEIPNIDIKIKPKLESHQLKENPRKKIERTPNETKTKTPQTECYTDKKCPELFECRIDKLVNQSVNHIFNQDCDKKKVFARTVFLNEAESNVKSMVLSQSEVGDGGLEECEQDSGVVLNLSVKEGRRKSHGRKQLAPRRITYAFTECEDGVLDLKIKREPQ